MKYEKSINKYSYFTVDFADIIFWCDNFICTIECQSCHEYYYSTKHWYHVADNDGSPQSNHASLHMMHQSHGYCLVQAFRCSNAAIYLQILECMKF